eukprot:TRINITY_DN4995_c0_g1_i1.p1 TRINITY_DN4995_c0_g1~~TRINITY_DN4995_c0_g1_i1.p1  ORF type:complete len:524 (-),score=173.35 TRINITY_DN4995_c0_g1_i1:151-1722(-)
MIGNLIGRRIRFEKNVSSSSSFKRERLNKKREREGEIQPVRWRQHKILMGKTKEFNMQFKNPDLREFFKGFDPKKQEINAFIKERMEDVNHDGKQTIDISKVFKSEGKHLRDSFKNLAFKNEEDPSLQIDPEWKDMHEGVPNAYHKAYALIDDSGAKAQTLTEVRRAILAAEQLRLEEAIDEDDEEKQQNYTLEELREVATRDTVTEILIDQRDEEIEPIILSLQSRKDIYSLHIENPEKYSIDHLAIEYQARPDKIAMILIFEHHRRTMERRQKKPLRENFFDVAQDNFFDFTEDKLNDDVKAIQMKTKSEKVHQRYLVVPEDLDEVEFAKQFNDIINLKKTISVETHHQEHFITHKPPTKNKFYADPVVLLEGNRTPQEIERHKKKFPVGTVNFNTYEINHSPKRNDFNREIVVTELDGTVRGAYWEERVALLSKKTTGNPTYVDTVEAYLGPHYRNRPQNKMQVEQDDKADNQIADECARNQTKNMHTWGGIPSLPKRERNTKIPRNPIWWAKNSPTQNN